MRRLKGQYGGRTWEPNKNELSHRCRGCGEEFERGNIGRPTPYCVECRRIKHLRQMVAWRAANQAHVRERAAMWRASHREELREKNRIYMRGYRARQKIDKLLS